MFVAKGVPRPQAIVNETACVLTKQEGKQNDRKTGTGNGAAETRAAEAGAAAGRETKSAPAGTRASRSAAGPETETAKRGNAASGSAAGRETKTAAARAAREETVTVAAKATIIQQGGEGGESVREFVIYETIKIPDGSLAIRGFLCIKL